MEQWQDAASRHVKVLTDRLNQLLSGGLGLDLGLKPERLPPWLSLLAAGAGLLLMLALWASVCRGLFSKKRPAVTPLDDGVDTKRAAVKAVKAEEQRKKKKKTEKKGQPNGRAVAEPQEEAVVPEEAVPHQQQAARGKPETEVKKSKKKAKQAVKETKTVTTDGKEPEEGTWETKVSNKEKREQRKKDKSSSDGSASPRGGDTPACTTPEQTKTSAAPPPANQKKKKGESTKVKPEKTEAAASQVNSSGAATLTASVPDKGANVPSHTAGPKRAHWTTSQEPASLWGAERDGPSTMMDSGMKTSDLNLVSFAGLGSGTAEAQPVRDLSWLSQPRVDDEWSGHNGGLVDPTSDWSDPPEPWGNYEEPTPEAPPTQLQAPLEPNKVNLIGSAVDDEDEKDKAGTAADGAAKAKKKKKKKKKAAEEGEVSNQVEEPKKEAIPAASVKKQPPVQENAAAAAAAVQPAKSAPVEVKVERSMKDNVSQKPPVTQVPQKTSDGESTAKQTGLPAPTQQKKPEESQAAKPAKKKKARRET